MELLQRGPWPGNVRELRNVLERASLFADDNMIRVEHLPVPLTVPATLQSNLAQVTVGAPADVPPTLSGTRKKLAEQMGISERTLYRRLKQQGIS